ncbi:hypothetical protein DdX_02705 [Ditylenchus destructor]|uniref:Pectinesterase inhibitor domain-containing protein n=1 Tax=Ditylenchus destructor TaxID=166010 RepID=A0AAD4NEQ3_9BILA|nr:hypothetical protein DdX_02705 [Ditylenchus destructor]
MSRSIITSLHVMLFVATLVFIPVNASPSDPLYQLSSECARRLTPLIATNCTSSKNLMDTIKLEDICTSMLYMMKCFNSLIQTICDKHDFDAYWKAVTIEMDPSMRRLSECQETINYAVKSGASDPGSTSSFIVHRTAKRSLKYLFT